MVSRFAEKTADREIINIRFKRKESFDLKKLAENADKVWRATSSAASVFLLFNMFLILANIIMRRFFKTPIFGSTELVSYASLITASLALAQNEWFEGNIQMTLILDKLPRQISKYVVFVDYLVCSGAFVFITYLLGKSSVKQFSTGDYSQDLKLSIYIFYIILTIGFAILTACIILKTIICAYNAFTGSEIKFTNKGKAAENPSD